MKNRNKGNRDNRICSVAVVATMSAGKSTLLNAMMGKKILPSKCTACTAGVFSVVDDDHASCFRVRGKKRSASRYSDWEAATPEVLVSMNDSAYARVVIEGNLKCISNFRDEFKVAFFDTPGPNNACDLTHAQILRNVLASSSFSSIIVMLDAAFLHTTDEYALISEVRRYEKSHRSSSSVVFVLNKMDALFHGRECNRPIAEILKEARKYLTEKFAFHHPIVIPTWASLALECRQLLEDPSYVDVLDEDDEDRLCLAIKKIQTHRAEIEAALMMPAPKVAVEEADPPKASDIVLKHSGFHLQHADLVVAERLSGIPMVEHWAEEQLNNYSSAVVSKEKSPSKKRCRKSKKHSKSKKSPKQVQSHKRAKSKRRSLR